jgi:hypothetical protein
MSQPSSAVERSAFNRVVVGSIPTVGAFLELTQYHSAEIVFEQLDLCTLQMLNSFAKKV